MQSWPADGVESVAYCPVCGEASREVMYTDLVDNAYRVAPGKWTLWKCIQCGSAYLDPRPTRDLIHLAYSNYYTHRVLRRKDDYTSLNALRKLRRRLVNGYTDWRYSSGEEPASHWGILVLLALLPQRRRLDSEYRHSPRRPVNGGKLLDVGCGDGSFLRVATRCDWHATGLDPDVNAVASCRSNALDVLHGGIERFGAVESRFDVITLNHVIEHVPDPIELLRSCYRLLKLGGQLWLQTPNIDSLGSRRYGRHWRGLEPPRHLVLFDPVSLRSALH